MKYVLHTASLSSRETSPSVLAGHSGAGYQRATTKPSKPLMSALADDLCRRRNLRLPRDVGRPERRIRISSCRQKRRRAD
jgi:hypothetical protein